MTPTILTCAVTGTFPSRKHNPALPVTPEEIADLAVYIAGATYTSGQAFAIDGGWTI